MDLFVFFSVVLICLNLHLKKKMLSKICMLFCLVLFNSSLFYSLICFNYYDLWFLFILCIQSMPDVSPFIQPKENGGGKDNDSTCIKLCLS